MRVFLTNPKKMIFISKTLMVIVLGIDYLVDNNSYAIIPLFSFFLVLLFFILYLLKIFLFLKKIFLNYLIII